MRALILVDLQYDFLPGGALAVPEGDAVLSVANRVQSAFDLVVATQDWHPRAHGSFAANHVGVEAGQVFDLNGLPQVAWPVHCVQGTRGAAFSDDLDTSRLAAVFQKGTDVAVDSYSGFFDNGRRHATGLGDWLEARGVNEVAVLGLATDYCVKFTALDAAELGFATVLIEDACRGVELKAGDCAAAISSLREAGVRIAASSEFS